MSKRFLLENRTEEANRMLKCVQGSMIAVHDLIASFDLVTIPSEQDVADLLNSDPLDTVNLYIEVCNFFLFFFYLILQEVGWVHYMPKT